MLDPRFIGAAAVFIVLYILLNLAAPTLNDETCTSMSNFPVLVRWLTQAVAVCWVG